MRIYVTSSINSDQSQVIFRGSTALPGFVRSRLHGDFSRVRARGHSCENFEECMPISVSTSGRIMPQEGCFSGAKARGSQNWLFKIHQRSFRVPFPPPTTHHPDLPSVHHIVVASGLALATFDVSDNGTRSREFEFLERLV